MTNGSILLVEDEQIVASDLKMTLEQLGYTVPVICKSGEEALAVVPEIMPDMALVDIILAGQMDGIETAEQIRKKYDIPFIYLTAHTDQNTIERAKITEPFGYIIKPFNEKELQSTLTMAFYKSKMD
ncbi:response regulator, partial [bacterium]